MSTAPPPADRLAELLSPAWPPWFRAGVRAWRDGGGDLEAHLGLDRRGHRLATRNRHIVAAWHLVEPDREPWQRALALSAEIRKFETRLWPRLRDRAEPDPRWPALSRELWAAFRAAGDIGLPQSPDQIRKIVAPQGHWIQEDVS